MAFPETPLPIKHEWLIDGTWTDVTSRTKLANGIDITTGYSGEQATLAAGTASSVVFNRDQFFSNRVPTATNYGKFSKNVQCRISTDEQVRYMRMADMKSATGAYDNAHASTADKAVLDITGDIDVRVDVQPDQWTGGQGIMLAGKFESSGDQRSWAFWVHRLGYLGFAWSTAGTLATRIDRYSDAPITGGGRKALRATLDVNNGSGGYTLTFYTSNMPQSASVQVPNGTFEAGNTTGWTPFDATFAASTTHNRNGEGSGQYAGLLTVVGSPSQAYVRPSTGAVVTAGRDYQVRMSLYSETARTVFVAVDWYDAAISYLSTTGQTFDIPANTWTMAEAIFKAPTSAVFAGHGPTLTGSPAAGTQIWVDDVQLYEITWTQLGSQIVTTAGTTSIFSSTASLVVGTVNSSSTYGAFNLPAGEAHTLEPFVGRIYGCQVFSGIAGTLVADFNAATQNVGDTTWADDLGTANTWALNASAAIDWQDYRFWGEVTNITPLADGTGTDVTCQITATDMLSRLRNGSKSIDSSVYSNLIRYADPAAGTDGTLDLYYPMEDNSSADRPTPTIGRNGAMFDCTFSTDETFPGSKGGLVFSSDSGWANGDGVPTGTTSNTGVATVLFYFYSPATPAAARGLIFYRFVGGTSVRVAINVENTVYRLIIVNSSGTELLNVAIGHGTGAEPNDQWIAMRVMLTQNGGNVDYEWGWYPIGAPVLYGFSGSYAGTIGRPSHWSSPSFASKTGWKLAHVAAMREALDWSGADFTDSTNAYVNEYPSARFKRLCRNHRIPYWVIGRQHNLSTDPTAEPDRMGAQLPKTVVALLEEAALVAGGYMYGPRDKFGVVLRLRNSVINRETTLLTYSQQELSESLVPRDDLFFARNEVEATRPSGGSALYTKTTGALNTSEPSDDPQGIGLYNPGPLTFNVELDSQLADFAREAVFFGTWDELRYVQASVQMERSQFTSDLAQTALVRALKLFDPIEITGFGSGNAPWLPPDNAELLILGCTEQLRNRGQKLQWNLMPYKPFRVNDLSSRVVSYFLIGPAHSTLNADITGSATSFAVATSAGKLWKTGTVDIDIKIGGEVMNVGTIAGSSSPQTFSNITRNVNNMATTKAHLAGAEVKLANTWYLHR